MLGDPPSKWLKNIDPGFLKPWGANFGLDFFTKQLVPFLVWAGVFFTIILSLIFLLVGGIMWISAFYWGALPALAAGINLCPPEGQPQPPGCTAAGVGAPVDIGSVIGSGLNLLMFIAFVAALVFLVVGGIKWILSGGDKEGATKAKETITSALIGLAVVLGAWILINIVLNFFGSPGGLTKLIFPTIKWQVGT
ncbi:hypothetical protein HY085_02710 [Candidatus Gottesmanbacteria bacterium]|nr:hypothetical protein [Candidatus Gottesmanbacteria bacterium]